MLRIVPIVTAVILTLALSLNLSGDASARGPTPKRLGDAGWTCFNVPGLGVHCQPPGADASSATISFLYFSDTSNPTDENADLTGTELLIRADLYHGQPCPQEGTEEWTGLDLFGGPEVDYYACHHK